MTDPTIDPVPPAPEPTPAPPVDPITPAAAVQPVDPTPPETPTPADPEHPVPVEVTPDPAAIEQAHGALATWFLAHEHALVDKVRTAVQTELETLHKYLTALKDRLTSHL